MKIALLSTPWIALPPRGYGGTELVVSNLADGLVKRGHDVTVYATGDSHTRAHLAYYFSKALGNNLAQKQNPYNYLLHIHGCMEHVAQGRYDIVHNHCGQIPMFFFDYLKTPFVHTMHVAFYEHLHTTSTDIEEKRTTMKIFQDQPIVSISNNQRQGIPELNYVKTIYNGIRPENFTFIPKPQDYLAWIGRVTPNKGLDTAIHVAKALNMKLKISAFVDDGEQPYFDRVIRPLLDSTIELSGELPSPAEKSEFLGNAIATLFPIQWDEPFGLVMIESMASGTPVIAYNRGSVPEVIEDGKTGYITTNENEMIDAVKKINSIDRAYCHTSATTRFSVDTMVDQYLEAYQTVIDSSHL